MEDLPLEIFRMVYENLSHGDLGSLRQTCSLFCNSINPTFFKSIDIFPFEKSFEWIVANPSIQQHVKCVRYIPKILPQVQNKESWRTSRKGLVRCMTDREHMFQPYFNAERVNAAWVKYREYYDSQSRVLQSGNLSAHFFNFFASLPNLEEVQLLDDNGTTGSVSRSSFRSTADLGRFHIVTQETLMNLSIREPVVEDRPPNKTDTEAAFRFMLVAANDNGIKLKKVVTTYLGYGAFAKNPFQARMRDAMKSVKHLYLGGGTATDDGSDTHWEGLSEFIAWPLNLETLHIAIGEEIDFDSQGNIWLQGCLEVRNFWPTLKFLHLEGMWTSEYEL